MGDGRSETYRKSYFSSITKTSEEIEKDLNDIERKERIKRIEIVNIIRNEPDDEKAQKILLEFLQG